MSEPIRDAEELGKIAWDAAETCNAGQLPWPPGDPNFGYTKVVWSEASVGGREITVAMAAAVAQAVFPEGYVVVPKAELVSLLALIADHYVYGFTKADRERFDAFRAVLGKEE